MVVVLDLSKPEELWTTLEVFMKQVGSPGHTLDSKTYVVAGHSQFLGPGDEAKID